MVQEYIGLHEVILRRGKKRDDNTEQGASLSSLGCLPTPCRNTDLRCNLYLNP